MSRRDYNCTLNLPDWPHGEIANQSADVAPVGAEDNRSSLRSRG